MVTHELKEVCQEQAVSRMMSHGWILADVSHGVDCTEKKARAYLEKEKKKGDMPENVTIITNGIGQFSLGRSGCPFARVFTIHLKSQEIHGLVMGLSNYLAQPIQESWDGSTITRLIA